tara:strand:- start:546 stop:659 length:114 start_codon:yes stop_codon:yes gene_type:complete
MDKINYDTTIDEGNEDLLFLKELADKINEIVDWINSQ